MKHLFLFLAVLFYYSVAVHAQSPLKFNYQGVARDNGGMLLADQAISLRLTLHATSETGSTVYQENQSVTTNQFGLFKLVIGNGVVTSGDLGSVNWGNDQYYLQIEMDPAGGSSFTDLGTSQLLSVPYAMFSQQVANATALPSGTNGQTLRSNGTSWVSNSNIYNNGNNVGIGTSTPFMKLHLEDPNGEGLLGFNGMFIKTNSATGGSSIWLRTDSDTAAAMIGLSGTGTPTPNTLLVFQANANPIAFATDGLDRMTIAGNGDVSVGHHQPLARLHVDGNTIFEGGDNVFNRDIYDGEGNMGIGLNQFNETVFSNYKLAVASNTDGVLLVHHNSDGQAARFEGNVDITGWLSKAGGSFKIDHPLDPENKFLYHSFVESPDMMNIYNGNVVTDGNGEAVVQLPDYFQALNKDLSYQLTPIGGLFKVAVLEEVKDNSFKIVSERPNAKVSWQVTGVRKDAYAETHRMQVTVPKTELETGKYLHPKAFGKTDEQGIRYGIPRKSSAK